MVDCINKERITFATCYTTKLLVLFASIFELTEFTSNLLKFHQNDSGLYIQGSASTVQGGIR